MKIVVYLRKADVAEIELAGFAPADWVRSTVKQQILRLGIPQAPSPHMTHREVVEAVATGPREDREFRGPDPKVKR